MLKNYKYIDVAVGLKGYIRKSEEEVRATCISEGVFNIYKQNETDIKGEKTLKGVEPLKLFSDNVDVDERLSVKHALGIGETGLDYTIPFINRDAQIKSFVKHLEKAKEEGKPVVAQCKSAFEDFYSMMEKYNPKENKVIVTRFDGTLVEMLKLLSLGCYIGIDDYIVEELNDDKFLMQIMMIPRNKMILYTGSPYSRVLNLNGKSRENYPWNIKEIISKLSRVLYIDEEEMREVAINNVCEVFNLG